MKTRFFKQNYRSFSELATEINQMESMSKLIIIITV